MFFVCFFFLADCGSFFLFCSNQQGKYIVSSTAADSATAICSQQRHGRRRRRRPWGEIKRKEKTRRLRISYYILSRNEIKSARGNHPARMYHAYTFSIVLLRLDAEMISTNSNCLRRTDCISELRSLLLFCLVAS